MNCVSPRGVRLLAYGTLGGGFLDGSVGRSSGADIGSRIGAGSKYKRFIDMIGGWARSN